MTSQVDIWKVREELAVYFRNSDILSIARRNVTTVTNESFAGPSTTAQLAHANVKNIRSITSNSGTLTAYTDYTIEYEGGNNPGKITFTVAQTNILITYDYGTDKIYTDFPRDDLTYSSYPRIAIIVDESRIEPAGLGGKEFFTDFFVTIFVFAPAEKENTTDAAGQKWIEDTIDDIKNYVQTNGKSFNNFKYMRPIKTSRIMPAANKNLYVLQKSIDFIIQFVYEQG